MAGRLRQSSQSFCRHPQPLRQLMLRCSRHQRPAQSLSHPSQPSCLTPEQTQGLEAAPALSWLPQAMARGLPYPDQPGRALLGPLVPADYILTPRMRGRKLGCPGPALPTSSWAQGMWPHPAGPKAGRALCPPKKGCGDVREKALYQQTPRESAQLRTRTLQE